LKKAEELAGAKRRRWQQQQQSSSSSKHKQQSCCFPVATGHKTTIGPNAISDWVSCADFNQSTFPVTRLVSQITETNRLRLCLVLRFSFEIEVP
jgi:hypothetical protein